MSSTELTQLATSEESNFILSSEALPRLVRGVPLTEEIIIQAAGVRTLAILENWFT